MTSDKIYKVFEELEVPFVQHKHEAVFTVEESQRVAEGIAFRGGKTKNLFLRNKKGDKHYLVVIEDSKRADLKRIGGLVGESKLSFASPERLEKYLGVTPGSVSALGLAYDQERAVQVLIDEDLMGSEYINCHPNDNTKTLEIFVEDFKKFLEWWGGPYKVVRL